MSDQELEFLDITSYEPAHASLLKLLREAGWRAGETPTTASADYWELADQYFFLNSPGMTAMVELSGIVLQVETQIGRRTCRFAPNSSFRSLAGIDGFETAVYKNLGTLEESYPQDGYPIGEVDGSVLFAKEDFGTVLIDHTLCGFFRAPNPFIILDWLLLEIPSDDLEHFGAYQGDSIIRFLDKSGQFIGEPD